jgi:hypothetical protein
MTRTLSVFAAPIPRWAFSLIVMRCLRFHSSGTIMLSLKDKVAFISGAGSM